MIMTTDQITLKDNHGGRIEIRCSEDGLRAQLEVCNGPFVLAVDDITEFIDILHNFAETLENA